MLPGPDPQAFRQVALARRRFAAHTLDAVGLGVHPDDYRDAIADGVADLLDDVADLIEGHTPWPEFLETHLPPWHQLDIDHDEPVCGTCGCSTDDPCPGGCQWVTGQSVGGELCSRCADLTAKGGGE